MTTKNSYQVNEQKAQLLNDFETAISMQLNGTMDSVRARAFWDTKLNDEISYSQLAEALARTLDLFAGRIRHGNI